MVDWLLDLADKYGNTMLAILMGIVSGLWVSVQRVFDGGRRVQDLVARLEQTEKAVVVLQRDHEAGQERIEMLEAHRKEQKELLRETFVAKDGKEVERWRAESERFKSDIEELYRLSNERR